MPGKTTARGRPARPGNCPGPPEPAPETRARGARLSLDLISRGLAFAIFVGSTSLHGPLAVAFTSGLHSAFYASMGFMALAAALSALRAGSSRI